MTAPSEKQVAAGADAMEVIARQGLILSDGLTREESVRLFREESVRRIWRAMTETPP